MFSYFGGKGGIAHKYPYPRYPLVIEPFAGSARYAMRHWDSKQIWLNDYDPMIAEMWSWMIGANKDDVLALPDIRPGEYVSSYNLERPQRNLMRFAVQKGHGARSDYYKGWSKHGNPLDDNSVRAFRKRLMAYLSKIRHWQVTSMDYRQLPNVEATWFIDAPYQGVETKYQHTITDYSELAEWCKTRKGQVIVCEKEGADWLPFRFLARRRALQKWQTEMIWTQERKAG